VRVEWASLAYGSGVTKVKTDRLKPVLLVIFFQQLLLVLGRFQALVGDDASGGRRSGQFASASPRLAACCELLRLALASDHGIGHVTSVVLSRSVPLWFLLLEPEICWRPVQFH
jgi:hypothetical protein